MRVTSRKRSRKDLCGTRWYYSCRSGSYLLGVSRHGGDLRSTQARDICDDIYLVGGECDPASSVRRPRIQATGPDSDRVSPECWCGTAHRADGSGWLFFAVSRPGTGACVNREPGHRCRWRGWCCPCRALPP